MIKSRNELLDILEEYLSADYEIVSDLYSGNDKTWRSQKCLHYSNGVVLGKYRDRDIRTMNLLKQGVSDEALLDEISTYEKNYINRLMAKVNPDTIDKARIDMSRRLLDELSIKCIDEWIDKNCVWIRDDTVDISYQEKRVLLYLIYAFENFRNQRRHPYCNETDQIDKVYRKILNKQSQLYKYGLVPIGEDRELITVYPPRVYDRRINRTFFTKNVPLDLLQQISKMISEGYIGGFSVRLMNEPGYEGRVMSELITEALEMGKLFDLVDLGSFQVSKLYSEAYEDCMWVSIDPNSITFEELCEKFDTFEDSIVTQVIHLQYDNSGEICYITHLDHEYIYYSLDEYEKRIKDVNQRGTDKKRMKSFKIDNARIPFDIMINIRRREDNGKCSLIKIQFLCYVLELFFKHKDLLMEYFQKL